MEFEGKKILHFVIDDKFTNHAIQTFKNINSVNEFWLLTENEKEFKYVNNSAVKMISFLSFFNDFTRNDLNKYDIYIFHSMSKKFLRMIEILNKDKKVIWIGWGYDYYTNLILGGNFNKLLLNQTKKCYNSNFFIKKPNLKSYLFLLPIISWLFRLKLCYDYRSISYFCPVLKEEYNIIKKRNLFFRPKFGSWNYGSLENNLLPNKSAEIIIENNILIGNSASVTNNHLDIFSIIAGFNNIIERQILVPLSYGDVKYEKFIKEKGISIFGEKISFLNDFVSIDEYFKLVNKCGNVIMPHLRQQGLGIIIMMMFYGAKIFLFQSNPLYNFFKKENVIIFSIEELIKNPDLLDLNLSMSDIEINRAMLRKYWSHENIMTRTNDLLKL